MADTKITDLVPGDSPKPHGDPLSNVTGGPTPVTENDMEPGSGGAKLHGDAVRVPPSGAVGNPAGYDQAALRGSGAPGSDAAATSKALHPAGSRVPEAAHRSPGMKLEEAIEAGLTDSDPADRPHGDPNRPAPEPIPPDGNRN